MPIDTIPLDPKIANAALFDAARRVMMAAYGEAIRHMTPLEAALEAEATISAMRQLRELHHG